jgi:hypothetical protein
MKGPVRLLDAIFSLAREADAVLAAPSIENARLAARANEQRAAARAALDLDLERFLDGDVMLLQMGGAK